MHMLEVKKKKRKAEINEHNLDAKKLEKNIKLNPKRIEGRKSDLGAEIMENRKHIEGKEHQL